LFGVVIGDDGSSFVALGSVDLIDVSVVVVSGVCEVSIFAISMSQRKETEIN